MSLPCWVHTQGSSLTKAANRPCLKVESVRIHIHMRETRHQTR